MKHFHRPTSAFSRLTWHLHHPAVALLSLGVIIWSILSLPVNNSGLGGNAGYTARLAGRPLLIATSSPYIFLHRLSSGDFEIIDTDKESWDRLSRLMADAPRDILGIVCTSKLLRRGVWYPSNELVTREVIITPMATPGTDLQPSFTDAELAHARVVYLNWLGSPAGGGSPSLAAMMAAGDQIYSHVYFPNFLRNLGTIAAVILLCLSLIGLPRYVRVWAAGRRLKRGLCGACRYDLRSTLLASGVVRCPECGTAWPAYRLPNDLFAAE